MKPWKVVLLTLISVFLVILIFNLFNPTTPPKAADDKMTRAYEAYMNEVKKKSDEYYKKMDETINKASAINDLSLKNQQKFEKILERWEKQADQMDKVLTRLEKNK